VATRDPFLSLVPKVQSALWTLPPSLPSSLYLHAICANPTHAAYHWTWDREWSSQSYAWRGTRSAIYFQLKGEWSQSLTMCRGSFLHCTGGAVCVPSLWCLCIFNIYIYIDRYILFIYHVYIYINIYYLLFAYNVFTMRWHKSVQDIYFLYILYIYIYYYYIYIRTHKPNSHLNSIRKGSWTLSSNITWPLKVRCFMIVVLWTLTSIYTCVHFA
jgi:hypothetical protein